MATTIARPYWLSGESPKRDAARAANGSAPPAAPLPLDCPAGWSVPAGAPSLLTGARSQAAGLAWSAVCCTVWHGSITGARLYIPYYNGAAVLTCTASGVAVVSGIGCKASGRVYVLQRVAGGIIAACAGMVSAAIEWGKLQETPL